MCCPGARHRWSKTAVVSTLIELDERGVAWITGTKVKVIEVATDKLNQSTGDSYTHAAILACASAVKRSTAAVISGA